MIYAVDGNMFHKSMTIVEADDAVTKHVFYE